MDLILQIILMLTGTLFFLFIFYAGYVSFFEKEKKALQKIVALNIIIPSPFFLLAFINFPLQNQVAWSLIIITVLILILLLFPFRGNLKFYNDTPQDRYDERNIMFSRNLLTPGTKRFEEYYLSNPDKKIPDDKFRSFPGLLSKNSKFYDPFSFASAEANFRTVKAFFPKLDGPVNKKLSDIDPQQISTYIKNWALNNGVYSVGITELKDYHLYSHHGRGEMYGKEVKNNHKYAICFTVEMNKHFLACAPLGPAIMESAQQYLNSGKIAVQAAEFIRELGFPARAHIDGNYHLICPLVARDAGLGEIGRMGLLMTPGLGPRVRISVVTTDIPLVPDTRNIDLSMIDFCSVCNKCARNCPVNAIPLEGKKEINNIERWQIDSEACFTFWRYGGTDCGICMSVCPYSHPDNKFHNFIRSGIRNSLFFRKLALSLDDFFYGKKPANSDLPDWIKGK